MLCRAQRDRAVFSGSCNVCFLGHTISVHLLGNRYAHIHAGSSCGANDSCVGQYFGSRRNWTSAVWVLDAFATNIALFCYELLL